MKLSIIIPMYNAEKYIANCLDSILNSDMSKDCYEVIIINDGSTDKGPVIAQDYVSRYENFIYLTQDNQGQSVARNYGIREARGEYVWCVDADDKLDSSIRILVYSVASHPNIDILAFRLKDVNENGDFFNVSCVQPVPHNIVISGRDAIIHGYFPSSVCALWIRKKLIIDNMLFFKEGITHQDVELSYRLFVHASQVLFTTYTPYIYIYHQNSTRLSLNPIKKEKYLCDEIIVYKSFMNLAHTKKNDPPLYQTIHSQAQLVVFSLLLTLFKNRKKWRRDSINKKVIMKMKKERLYPYSGKYTSIKKNLIIKLLNIEYFLT